jgi:hypothetical protein
MDNDLIVIVSITNFEIIWESRKVYIDYVYYF